VPAQDEGLIGRQVADYRIESKLGRGGQGVVYLAEHIHLGRKVALKVLVEELANDPSFRRRFLREARVAASLDHPNVLDVYDAGEQDGRLFLAVRLVRGSDLAALIEREGPMSPHRAVELLEPVAQALDAAHEAGLVHRDVKPGNILVEPAAGRRAERVYLADFGLTKPLASGQDPRGSGSLTMAGYFVGTPDYAAPEQIEGKEVDGRVDVYSLGCVLYHCLVGRVPFERDSVAGLLVAHMTEPPPRASESQPGVPAAMDQVIQRAMAKSRDDRFAGAAGMADAMREAAGPAPEEPVRPAPTVAAPPPVKPLSPREPAPAAPMPPVVVSPEATEPVAVTPVRAEPPPPEPPPAEPSPAAAPPPPEPHPPQSPPPAPPVPPVGSERTTLEPLPAETHARRRRRTGLVVGLIAAVLVVGILAVLLLGGGGGGGGGGGASPRGPSGAPSPELAGIQTGPPPWPSEEAHLAERLHQLGMPPLGAESVDVHIHQNLVVLVHGEQVEVPLIGQAQESGGSLYAEIHTHATAGTIHVESARTRHYTLGNVFDVWGVLFSWGPDPADRCLGSLCDDGSNQIRVFLDGHPVEGDPTALVLKDEQVIVVTYGTPSEIPDPIPSIFRYEAAPRPTLPGSTTG